MYLPCLSVSGDVCCTGLRFCGLQAQAAPGAPSRPPARLSESFWIVGPFRAVSAPPHRCSPFLIPAGTHASDGHLPILPCCATSKYLTTPARTCWLWWCLHRVACFNRRFTHMRRYFCLEPKGGVARRRRRCHHSGLGRRPTLRQRPPCPRAQRAGGRCQVSAARDGGGACHVGLPGETTETRADWVRVRVRAA